MSKSKKVESFSDQLRRLIDESDQTRYQIAKATDVDAAVLCRFVAGEAGLSMASIDKLAEYFGWKVVADRPPKQPGK